MDKMLVNIFVPVLGMSFDVFAPRDVPVATVVSIVAGGIADLEGDKYTSTGMEQLMVSSPRMLLSPGKTLGQYGIQDGDRLILL